MTAFALVGAFVLYPLLWRLAAVDRATFRLPNRLTMPLLGTGLVWSAAMQGGWPWAALLGAAVGYGVFAAIGWVFFRWRGLEGLGLGDAKLLAAGGAWTGVATLPWIVLLATVVALAAAMTTGAGRGARIAFGPWLALAIGVCWAALRVIS